uniref:Translocation protein SEC62 n=1 Tax=Strigamia maritima TaxID=126957 RepID=T1IL68_STRMM
MADKRKGRKRKEEVDEKPSKEEYAVAKYMRNHVPLKKASLLSHKVEYFIAFVDFFFWLLASKAVECLLDSPWATNKKGKEALFTSRESVIEYLNTMLIHKFFHRAKKILISQRDVKTKKKLKDQDDSSNPNDKEEKKSVEKKKKEKEKDNESKNKQLALPKDVSGDKEKKKEKRKIKLDMHLEQIFVDGSEAYVWIYDPIPTTAWLIGSLLVVGAILLCLFPLWPSSVRKGVYYVSVAAAAFLCVIVALIIMRLITFCVIWLVSFGKHHLWILPNLTEDVGFFESFWPLFKVGIVYILGAYRVELISFAFQYEYKGAEKQGEPTEKAKSLKSKEVDEKEASEEREPTDSESEETNGFEIVNQEELEKDTCKNRKRTKKEKSS